MVVLAGLTVTLAPEAPWLQLTVPLHPEAERLLGGVDDEDDTVGGLGVWQPPPPPSVHRLRKQMNPPPLASSTVLFPLLNE